MADARDLIAHAREAHVVVIGGGVAGAVVALDCAKVGMDVTVLEAADRLGGVLAGADLDGWRVDGPTDSFAADAPALSGLLTELGLADLVRPVEPATRWIGTAPLPGDAVLGIPANPWDPAVRALIGWRGTWRAYLDRLRPPLTIGHERRLGALVRSRMGDRVCERMVAPVTRALFDLEPEQVDVELAAPGLSSALTRTGSLAGAVAAADPSSGARATLAGGLAQLPLALAEQLERLGVGIRTGSTARRLSRDGDGWLVTAVAAGDDEEEIELRADVVVLATGEADVRRLLDGVLTLPEGPAVHETDLVLLRVRMPEAARADVFPVRGPARRITDVTDAGSAGAESAERIVRVALPASGDPDETVAARARDAASEAFGRPLVDSDVRAAVRMRATTAPREELGRDGWSAGVRRAVHGVRGLAAAGAWIATDELAEVVADARDESSRVRRLVLWGEDREAEPERHH